MVEPDAFDRLHPTVVAIDPGGTTGWAVIAVHPDALCDSEVSVLRNVLHSTSGEIVGGTDVQEDECVALIEAWESAAVVVEDFILRTQNKAREVLSPVRLTAVIDYELRRGGRRAVRQSASMAKTTVSDERLREWGWWTRGSDHERDANRHALTLLRRAKTDPRLRERLWPWLYGGQK